MCASEHLRDMIIRTRISLFYSKAFPWDGICFFYVANIYKHVIHEYIPISLFDLIQ